MVPETSIPFINIHSHRKPQIQNEVVIRNGFDKITKEFATKVPYYLSVGIHPWFIPKGEFHFFSELLSLFDAANVLAIGETGLDRSVSTPLSFQVNIFEKHLQLALKLQKPVILHCVRAYSDIIPFLKKYNLTYIFHDYRGNEEQTFQLLKYNTYFSFGKSLFTTHDKHASTLRNLPEDRYFLETDNADITISRVYLQASKIRNVPEEQIKKEVFYTFVSVFKKTVN